jgi:2-keto-4-pentenoate hydratase
MMPDASLSDIAEAFVQARRQDKVLATYPGQKPQSFDHAYEIQDAAIALNGAAVSGWKVGRVQDQLVAHFGAERLVGPIFSNTIVHAPRDGMVTVPVLQGFAAVEAELMLRIGGDAADVRSAADARMVIDEMRFGLEIASSPFAGINDHGPAVTASDFGNNYGLVLGPVLEDWQDRDLLHTSVELMIDGNLIGQGKAVDMLDGPFGAVSFLLQLLKKRGIAVPPGTWVSTGAITGVHRVSAGQTAEAIFGSRENVSARMQIATPN